MHRRGPESWVQKNPFQVATGCSSSARQLHTAFLVIACSSGGARLHRERIPSPFWCTKMSFSKSHNGEFPSAAWQTPICCWRMSEVGFRENVSSSHNRSDLVRSGKFLLVLKKNTGQFFPSYSKYCITNSNVAAPKRLAVGWTTHTLVLCVVNYIKTFKKVTFFCFIRLL